MRTSQHTEAAGACLQEIADLLATGILRALARRRAACGEAVDFSQKSLDCGHPESEGTPCESVVNHPKEKDF
jgi:hypothetical protein